MKEESIRPKELKRKGRRLLEHDARQLLRFKSRFVGVSCPACGKRRNGIFFVRKGYVFKKCSFCESLYISPRPTPDILAYYYTNSKASKFWQTHIFPQARTARVEKIYKPRVNMILNQVKRCRIKTDVLLDIGAGSGFFGLEIARRKVFKKIILIEPGPMEIKNHGLVRVIKDSIENVSLNEKPDVVTSFEVIEHIFSPVTFLRKIYNLMGKKSFLLFTVPNFKGFEVMTVFDKTTNIAGPNHLNYFNTYSIKVLLERINFKEIEVTTPGELDADIVRNNHIEGVIDLSDQPFLHYILIEKPATYLRKFQEFLKDNKLSSHMLIKAKK
ncbi:MAG: class I SAM-dependent methyltransferase [Candidatus Omnitrophota bacterium]